MRPGPSRERADPYAQQGQRAAGVTRLVSPSWATRRGVERGELRPGLDVAVAIDALYGALYYRLLVSQEPLSPDYARAVVDVVFAGLSEVVPTWHA